MARSAKKHKGRPVITEMAIADDAVSGYEESNFNHKNLVFYKEVCRKKQEKKNERTKEYFW
ncbi:hypothetical protein EDM54_10510 [Brevibacillus borstelensis]|jgi:hypothetical protein|uniref:Uncharacterized protein n=1 Tax=Brevibacillus borstelensis AK1 TaxID=1300222 RepID=M8D914_9BACL|nr:hypothetical protein I532_08217 [Brevibacillus borstelensis AK1]KKX55817.1 hypothetical protein X546_09225 [Brevibacillus borstelensis cifa_chp40]RNB63725.1 hypothetical protein EDM54_10510 [Brevibacillus borstelensis]GED50781.1 hypothetical protein BBO01nite_00220 [Brevibacillus borstelensis]